MRTLSELRLIDAAPEESFDRLTRLASQVLGVPVSLVSIIDPDRDRQYFKSSLGLPEPWSSARQTPLSHSFCKHVCRRNAPLAIADSRLDPLVSDNGAVHDLNVIAYLGVPILGPDGAPVGSFCAIEGRPRAWSPREVAIMTDLAACASDQVHLIATALEASEAHREAVAEAAARWTFLTHVNHEIRTPMNGILGAADLLVETLEGAANAWDPDESFRLARTIDDAAHLLLRLLDDALDIARADAGRFDLSPRVFHPGRLATDIAALHGPSARAKGVELTVDGCAAAERPRVGDDHRITQVLGNLVGNAVKFTAAGRVTLSVDATNADLTFIVSDTGPGMSAAEQRRLFHPFSQARPDVARNHGGSGLGMMIVAGLVQAMEGGIEVDSAPGRGTSITVRLPLPLAGEDAIAPDETSIRRRSVGQPFAGRRVLIADDTAANRLIVQTLLARLGAAVKTVTSGEEVLKALSADRFDAIFLDIYMPGMSGVETMKRVVRTDPSRRPLAVAVTANALPDQIAAYRTAGFDAVLIKPLRRADVIQISTLLPET